MPRITDFSAITCSIARASSVLGESWTPLILRDVYVGLRRFDELAADLGVARAVLTTRLERMVAEELLAKVTYSQRPPRYEYHLTEKGRELMGVLLALLAWGDRWLAGDEGPPVRLRHAACGHDTTPVVSCDHCSRPLDPDDIRPYAGPGARDAPGTHLIGTKIPLRP
ncbi:winged helix-turn-helix transcriptional regulator [Amycolatopsis nigrescens]|uniref:winged helix-turn-helix transcriptional regulator n=1 Tax=Amycolatopsis nigrescens TaxID=381445 RepID=UPI00036BA644|nr:helix-turn-helix domain-containing protein [Amycolatopsis nigrescens]